MATLRQNEISSTHRELLTSTRDIGQLPSMKNKLKILLKRHKAGLELSDDERSLLFKTGNIGNDVYTEPSKQDEDDRGDYNLTVTEKNEPIDDVIPSSSLKPKIGNTTSFAASLMSQFELLQTKIGTENKVDLHRKEDDEILSESANYSVPIIALSPGVVILTQIQEIDRKRKGESVDQLTEKDAEDHFRYEPVQDAAPVSAFGEVIRPSAHGPTASRPTPSVRGSRIAIHRSQEIQVIWLNC